MESTSTRKYEGMLPTH